MKKKMLLLMSLFAVAPALFGSAWADIKTASSDSIFGDGTNLQCDHGVTKEVGVGSTKVSRKRGTDATTIR